MLMWERTITGLYSVVSPFYLFFSFLTKTPRFRLFTFSRLTKTPRFHFFPPHQSPRHDTISLNLPTPRSLPLPDVAGGLKLLSERPSVEPCYHVQDEEVPILEPPVQHRLAILRQIILMERSEALKIPAEEYDCLPCQETCLGGVSVPEKPTEDEIVDTYPYRPLPRRWGCRSPSCCTSSREGRGSAHRLDSRRGWCPDTAARQSPAPAVVWLCLPTGP